MDGRPWQREPACLLLPAPCLPASPAAAASELCDLPASSNATRTHARTPLHALPLPPPFQGGLIVNFSVAGGTLFVADERNQRAFGEGTTGRTTLGGLDPTPPEMAPLIAKIDEIIARGK